MKNGWFLTWPDTPDYSIFWMDSEKMGRMYKQWDGQWQWHSWVLPRSSGFRTSEDEAKAIIEQRAGHYSLTSNT